MPTTRFTDRGLRAIQPPAKSRVAYFDNSKAAIPGLGFRVTAKGSKSWCLWYRQDGTQHLLTLGHFPEVGVADAKENAKSILKKVARGEDPATEKQDRRKAPTMRQLAKDYLEDREGKKRASSLREDRDMLNRIVLPRLGARKVATITHEDIKQLHKSIGRTPYRANRVVALLSKMFSLSEVWLYRPQHTNPCLGIEKYAEEKRDRWLTGEEMKRLITALNQTPYQDSADVVRLLLLTGARSGEVLGMTWDMIDFERGVWTKPSHHTKQRKVHRLPLSTTALALLSERRDKAGDGPYVFPGRHPGSHLTTLKTFWTTLCKTGGLQDFRIHDLRHTHASYLVSSGLSLHIVGQLLGHTQAATTHRYSHVADDPLREAANRIGALFTAVNEKESVL